MNPPRNNQCIVLLLLTSFLVYPASKAFSLEIKYKSIETSDRITKKQSRYRKHHSQHDPEISSHKPLYNQNAGYDPNGWMLGGPALDAAGNALQRPYYESYGFNSLPRNYIYYDWGW